MKIQHDEITEEGDYYPVEKISQHFIDSSFNEWCHGLEKKLNVFGRMTVNMSNTAILLE